MTTLLYRIDPPSQTVGPLGGSAPMFGSKRVIKKKIVEKVTRTL